MARLRWGLLGTARINRLFIPAVRASARSAVHAVASRDPERADAYARHWDIPRAYGSYDALLQSGEVDAVYVSLPNSLHVPWTQRALEAGAHVLCEKPLALRALDVDALARLAHARDRVLAEGFLYWHHAQTARVRQLLADGVIGDPKMVVGVFTYPQSRVPDVRLDPALGGGALWDVGCYPVSYANLVAGTAPCQVHGLHHLGPTGVDEHFAGTLRYGNGLVAQFQVGFRAVYETAVRIVGTAGVLDIPHPFRPATAAHVTIRRGESQDTVAISGRDVFVDELDDFEATVLDGRPATMPLADSRALALTLETLDASARAGATLTLPA